MSNTIYNERVKLRAAALNSAAGSLFTAGVVAPMVAAFYNLGGPHVTAPWMALGVAVCLALTAALYWGAQRVLRGLRNE